MLGGLFSLNSEAHEHSPWMFSSGDRKSSLNIQAGLFFWVSLRLQTPLGSICGAGCQLSPSLPVLLRCASPSGLFPSPPSASGLWKNPQPKINYSISEAGGAEMDIAPGLEVCVGLTASRSLCHKVLSPSFFPWSEGSLLVFIKAEITGLT